MWRQKPFKIVKKHRGEQPERAASNRKPEHLRSPFKHPGIFRTRVVKCPRRTGTSNLDLLLHLKTLTEVLTHLKLWVVAGYIIIFTDVLVLSITFYLASQPRLHRSGPAKDSVRYRGLLPSHKLPLHCSHFISLLNRALYII